MWFETKLVGNTNKIKRSFLLGVSITLLGSSYLTISVYASTTSSSSETCLENHDYNEHTEMIRAGYLPDYRAYIDLNRTAVHLTDIMLFSIEPALNGSITKSKCCLDSSHFAKAREAREYKQKQKEEKYYQNLSQKDQMKEFNSTEYMKDPLRILVSVGGAGRSSAFSSIVKSPKKRKRLILQLKDLCEREQLNGVDFDWEQPSSMEDYQNYFTLFQEAYTEFHKSNNNLIVTVALHPNQILPESIYEYIDRIHLMTYDMIKSKGQNKFEHHASYDNTIQTIQNFVQHGAPRSKMVMGIPCYARHERNPGQVKTYSEVIDMMKANKDLDVKTQIFSDSSKNQILFQKVNKYYGYMFDSPNDIEEKVKYTNKNNLGGVFVWEIGQDYHGEDLSLGGILIEAVATTFSNF